MTILAQIDKCSIRSIAKNDFVIQMISGDTYCVQFDNRVIFHGIAGYFTRTLEYSYRIIFHPYDSNLALGIYFTNEYLIAHHTWNRTINMCHNDLQIMGSLNSQITINRIPSHLLLNYLK